MDYAAFYAQHLGKIKWGAKGEGMARCPFHQDKKASLAVNRSRGVWFCHACNEGGTARQFAERLDADPPPSRARDPEAIYLYTDEEGRPLFHQVRLPGKKFYLERYAGPGRWQRGLAKTRRVLYRLPKLVKAPGLILVPEGERDVESLVRLGLDATTNPMGAGKWLPEYNESLRGKPVAILGDNDEPGRQHAQDVARHLHGIAASVKVLEFPDLPEHGDVSDAIARGLTKEQLLARLAQAPEWSPALLPPARLEGQTLGRGLARASPGAVQGAQAPRRLHGQGGTALRRGREARHHHADPPHADPRGPPQRRAQLRSPPPRARGQPPPPGPRPGPPRHAGHRGPRRLRPGREQPHRPRAHPVPHRLPPGEPPGADPPDRPPRLRPAGTTAPPTSWTA